MLSLNNDFRSIPGNSEGNDEIFKNFYQTMVKKDNTFLFWNGQDNNVLTTNISKADEMD